MHRAERHPRQQTLASARLVAIENDHRPCRARGEEPRRINSHHGRQHRRKRAALFPVGLALGFPPEMPEILPQETKGFLDRHIFLIGHGIQSEHMGSGIIARRGQLYRARLALTTPCGQPHRMNGFQLAQMHPELVGGQEAARSIPPDTLRLRLPFIIFVFMPPHK
jgi:hypothetical protein